MNFFALLTSGIVGLAVSWLTITGILLRSGVPNLARRGQDLHHGSAPAVSRLGGIALAAGFSASAFAMVFLFPGLLVLDRSHLVIILACLAMFGLGLWDDLRPLGARRKLAFQILVAILVHAGGLRIDQFQVPLIGTVFHFGVWGSILVTVGWLVALTNLVNLIDGVDGLAGGISLMLMCLLSYVCFNGAGTQFLCVGMAGALIGFLRFNFPPARIYMGDGGAYMLGFLVGVTTISSSQKGTIVASLAAPLFVLALPIIDTSVAILRRGLRGLPIFRPDRRHIHHRLLAQGWSRRRTVITIYCFCLLFLGLGFAAFWSRGQWLPALSGLGVLIVLLAAGKLSFSREWFFVGRVIGNSLRMRSDIQYALAQIRWLEMEARRSQSVELLWKDFLFIASKLGFVGAQLRLSDGVRDWDQSGGCRSVRTHSATLENGTLGVLDLRARVAANENEAEMCPSCGATCDCQTVLDPETFDIVSEVLIEGWLKAARGWMRYQNEERLTEIASLRFDMSRLPSVSFRRL